MFQPKNTASSYRHDSSGQRLLQSRSGAEPEPSLWRARLRIRDLSSSASVWWDWRLTVIYIHSSLQISVLICMVYIAMFTCPLHALHCTTVHGNIIQYINKDGHQNSSKSVTQSWLNLTLYFTKAGTVMLEYFFLIPMLLSTKYCFSGLLAVA